VTACTTADVNCIACTNAETASGSGVNDWACALCASEYYLNSGDGVCYTCAIAETGCAECECADGSSSCLAAGLVCTRVESD